LLVLSSRPSSDDLQPNCGQHQFCDWLRQPGVLVERWNALQFSRGVSWVKFVFFGSLASSQVFSFFPLPHFATEQVYRPVSPTFGGNALNGNFLLSTAQAQGNGVKSGQQGPDLSGLNNALSGIGGNSQQPVIIIGGSGPDDDTEQSVTLPFAASLFAFTFGMT
jgi:curli production assembly/transport component CsgF